MKTSFFAGLLLLTLGAAQAQTTPAKTKTKSTGPVATVKTKTKAAAPATPKAAVVPTPPAAQVEARANALTDNMRQALNLTPQQTEKVRQINLSSVRNVETARLQYRTDLRKLNGFVDDIGQSRMASLKEVLTPDQFARYQHKREEKMGVPNAPGIQGNPAPGLPTGNE